MRERQLVRSIRDGVGSSTVGICTFLPALGIIRVALLPTAFIVAFFFYEGSLVPKRATYLAEQSQDGVVPVPQEDALEFIE